MKNVLKQKLNTIVIVSITILICLTTMISFVVLTDSTIVDKNEMILYKNMTDDRISTLENELEDKHLYRYELEISKNLPRDKGYINSRTEYSEREIKLFISKHTSNISFINESSSFISATRETGIDTKFLIALSAIQTGWGSSNNSIINNNMFAINAKQYPSKKQSIIEGSKLLKTMFLNEGKVTVEEVSESDYYKFDTLADRLVWVYNIEKIMNN